MLPLDRRKALEKLTELSMSMYPAASWYPGPTLKRGYYSAAGELQTSSPKNGIICHSMVGSVDNALARLELSPWVPRGDASWQFSVTKTGKVLQHYDSLDVCWHAGSRVRNFLTIGIEHEGGPEGNESEPLTPAQLAASVDLVSWLCDQHGIPQVRDTNTLAGLLEHNQVYATACPSGRIPWEEYTTMDFTDKNKQEIAEIVKWEIAAERNERTQDMVAAAKLALEQFRQELTASGQLPPPHP